MATKKEKAVQVTNLQELLDAKFEELKQAILDKRDYTQLAGEVQDLADQIDKLS